MLCMYCCDDLEQRCATAQLTFTNCCTWAQSDECVGQVALSLNNLAALLRKMSKGEQAEQLYMRSLFIREEALGPDHPQVNPWPLPSLVFLLYQMMTCKGDGMH